MHPRIAPASHRRTGAGLAVAAMAATAAAAALMPATPGEAQAAGSPADATFRSAQHEYRVVTVVDGLEHPWSLTFLPGGDMLVTERPGRLRIVRDGRLLAEPVPGLPGIRAGGQGGLLDVVPQEEIFEARAWSSGRGHYGSRLAFDGDGYLYITIGDRQAPPRGDLESHPAQDLLDHMGTTLRLHDDGRVPTDNPFVGRTDALPEIWSYGHRNAQGMAVHPETNEVWQNEHGPQGGDELNLIQPGVNYGWPVIGHGVQYRGGAAIHEATHREGMEQPVHFWTPSIATSGLLIYTGDAFPGWRGNFFVGGLAGEQLARLTLDGHRTPILRLEPLAR
jgi:aldose sugar dehydrogenase